MKKVIHKRQGWNGLMVKVEASLSYPGHYEIAVYYPGWVGTAFSKDGMGWEGVGFHGSEDEIKAIVQSILEGVEKERKAVKQVVTKYAEKKFDEVILKHGK